MMRPKLITSFLLFVSSYTPLFLMLVIKDYSFIFYSFQNTYLSIGTLSIVLIANILLLIILRLSKDGQTLVEIEKAESKSNEFISYTIPYLLAFYGADWTTINNILSLLLFLSVLFVLSLRSGTLFINPILALLGYSLYYITYSYAGTFKSALSLSQFEPRPGDEIDMISIGQNLFIITSRKERDNADANERDSKGN